MVADDLFDEKPRLGLLALSVRPPRRGLGPELVRAHEATTGTARVKREDISQPSDVVLKVVVPWCRGYRLRPGQLPAKVAYQAPIRHN